MTSHMGQLLHGSWSYYQLSGSDNARSHRFYFISVSLHAVARQIYGGGGEISSLTGRVAGDVKPSAGVLGTGQRAPFPP